MERWAFAGLVVTVGALVLYMPLLGVVAYVLPAAGALIEANGADAMAVIDRTWTDPFIFLPFVGGILWNVGEALLGIAVWRSEALSNPGGIALLAAGLIGIPGFFDVVILQYIGTVVLAGGLILVGASLWRAVSNADVEG